MTFDMASIRAAAERLSGSVVRTPLLESPQLNDLVGARVLVKAESLQLTGSFKIRGALNCTLSMTPGQRQAGLVTFSAGNHGQGVAAAAKLVGVPAVIVMPHTAARVKVQNCRWWGAEVVFYDPARDDRTEVAQTIARTRGMVLIPPFDDHDVMSGQGTVGLEMSEELDRLDIRPDAVVVNASGGGLASGVIEAMTNAFPHIASYVTEPAGADKVADSLRLHSPQTLDVVPDTVMDALAGPSVGKKTFAALSRHSITGLTVTEEQAMAAVAAAFCTLRVVAEPGGAASLGAVLAARPRFKGQVIALVVSGGNVDPAVFISAIR
ncbi:MAG: threonine/serine dehydratase [Microterricola sp.]